MRAAETFRYHYGKHYGGYVRKLNAIALLEDDDADGTSIASMTLEEIIQATPQTEKVFSLASQAYNHELFWNSISPSGGSFSGSIAELIIASFGSLEDFQSEFSAVASSHFGSGWIWLVWDESESANAKVRIVDTHDAGNPLTDGLIPLLVLDVWEHAYYIDFRNDRAKYIEAFWSVVNWEFANERLNEIS